MENPIAYVMLTVFGLLYLGFVFVCFRFAHTANRPWQARGVGTFVLGLGIAVIFHATYGKHIFGATVIVSALMTMVGLAQRDKIAD
jgi:hypothetical protein